MGESSLRLGPGLGVSVFRVLKVQALASTSRYMQAASRIALSLLGCRIQGMKSANAK